MVSDVSKAGFVLVVVASKEILDGADSHVTGGHGDVCVPTQIVWRVATGRNKLTWPFVLGNAMLGPLSIVHSVVVACAQREVAHRPLRVIGNVVHVRRKERLVQ